MARLTAARRKKLKKSTFGLPGRRAYPMPDRAHAANAKARATQQYRKGRLSKSAKDRIHAKANRILGKSKSKSRTKARRGGVGRRTGRGRGKVTRSRRR